MALGTGTPDLKKDKTLKDTALDAGEHTETAILCQWSARDIQHLKCTCSLFCKKSSLLK